MIDRGQRRLLGLAVASQTSISVVQWGLGALGPELKSAYSLSAAGLGGLLAAGSIGNAAALVTVGRLIDRIGPRRPLIVGGLVSGVLLVAGGLAPNVWLLGAVLFLYGVSGALVAVAGTVSVFHGFAPTRRGFALGVRQMAVAGGGLVAAGLLPGLSSVGGVRLALAVAGALAGVCATVFGLASPHGALAAYTGPRRGATRALLVVPGMRRLLLVAFVQVCVLMSVLAFAVPAIRAEGASALVGGALFAIISVSAMAARLAWGRIADRGDGTRRRATLRDVGLLAAGGALAYWAAGRIGPAAELPVMFVFAFGALGFNGLVYLIGGELAGPERAGQAVGLCSTVLFGGSALAAVPLGLLADHAGYAALWPTAAALAGIGVAMTLGLPSAAAREPLVASG